jgi:hypothetical protein
MLCCTKRREIRRPVVACRRWCRTVAQNDDVAKLRQEKSADRSANATTAPKAINFWLSKPRRSRQSLLEGFPVNGAAQTKDFDNSRCYLDWLLARIHLQSLDAAVKPTQTKRD